MFFIFLVLLSCIPICVGITILVLFEKNKLSKIIISISSNGLILAIRCCIFVCV